MRFLAKYATTIVFISDGPECIPALGKTLHDIATCFIRRKEPYKTQNADFLNSLPDIWNKARPPTGLTVGS